MNLPAGVTATAVNAYVSESGVTGPGALNVSGTLRTRGGVDAGAVVTALAGCSLMIDNQTFIGAGASLRNGGAGVILPGSIVTSGGEIRNLAGATLSMDDGGVSVTPCCSASGVNTVNQGTMSTPLAGNTAALTGLLSNSGNARRQARHADRDGLHADGGDDPPGRGHARRGVRRRTSNGSGSENEYRQRGVRVG